MSLRMFYKSGDQQNNNNDIDGTVCFMCFYIHQPIVNAQIALKMFYKYETSVTFFQKCQI